MDPTLSPFNFEPTNLTPEQLAAMMPKMGMPANIPGQAPHPLEGLIPRMLASGGGAPATPPAPGVGGDVLRGPAPGLAPPRPQVGGGIPEAVAGQLARWGVTPQQLGPMLAGPKPSLGAALAPGAGIGGEAARDAAGAIPAPAAPASGMAPTTPAAGSNPFAGLSMPKPPEPQRISTPPPPKPNPVKSGELLALLQSLGVGGQVGLDPLNLARTIGR